MVCVLFYLLLLCAYLHHTYCSTFSSSSSSSVSFPHFFSHARQGERGRKQVGSGTDYGGAGRNAIMHGAEAEEGGKEKEEKGERGRKTILTSERRKRERGGGEDFLEDDPRDRPWRSRRPKRPRP